MKGLDTSALLGLLHGDPTVRKVLRSWSGEEIVTSELCLAELTAIALRQPSKVRAHRLQVLERLRRRISVLPVDPRATTALATRSGLSPNEGGLLGSIVLAALETAGCDEVLTGPAAPPARSWGKLKVRKS